jgi:hypothetical protein
LNFIRRTRIETSLDAARKSAYATSIDPRITQILLVVFP